MRAFKFISRLDLGFLFFIDFILVVASGMITTSFVGSLIMYMLLFFILYLLYGIWYIVYKLGMYFYQRKLKDIFNESKKFKQQIQES